MKKLIIPIAALALAGGMAWTSASALTPSHSSTATSASAIPKVSPLANSVTSPTTSPAPSVAPAPVPPTAPTPSAVSAPPAAQPQSYTPSYTPAQLAPAESIAPTTTPTTEPTAVPGPQPVGPVAVTQVTTCVLTAYGVVVFGGNCAEAYALQPSHPNSTVTVETDTMTSSANG